MSDVIVTPEAAPVVAADAPKAATAADSGEEKTPHWLPARLERERRSILKDLGIDSVDDAKKAIADLKAKQEAEKSVQQRAVELESSLKSANAEKQAMAEALGLYAKGQLGALSEAQRNAVMAVAGDDPAKQLKTLEALRPTWASAPASQAAAPAPAPAKPKDTAPAPSAPRDSGNGSPPDHKAIYADLKTKNPVLAARYALEHGVFDS